MGCGPSKLTRKDGSSLDEREAKQTHNFQVDQQVHATVDCNGKRPDQYGFGGPSFWAAKVLPMTPKDEEEHWNVRLANSHCHVNTVVLSCG